MDNSYDIPPVFLIGYMGCGKTTFGRALARATGREFIDLDFYISQRFRMTIPEIFAAKGEEEFRRMEREMLREAGGFSSVVIACGGGTPCHFDNMDYMNLRGLTVWLQASHGRLLERLVRGAHKRPLLAGKSREEISDYIVSMLEQRTPWYSKARITFDSDELENSRLIAGSVERFLSLPEMSGVFG